MNLKTYLTNGSFMDSKMNGGIDLKLGSTDLLFKGKKAIK
jgi:hypothetical protein